MNDSKPGPRVVMVTGQRCGKGDEGPSAQQATGEPVTVDWSQMWPKTPAAPDHKRVPQRPSGRHSGRGRVCYKAPASRPGLGRAAEVVCVIKHQRPDQG